MQAAFVIKDRSGKPYAVVGLLNGGTEFYPISENAKSWSKWMSSDYSARKITKPELIQTLDNSMDIEGPKPYNRVNKPSIDELIKNIAPAITNQTDKTKSLYSDSRLLPVISISDANLSDLDNSEWKNAVNFKSAAFLSDINKSTFSYEVKRTRAVWDPSLSVPGTDRRGGWRCPVGTRYGGEITDRFGRNCGWGVARRLGNAMADLGERIEDAGDARLAKRVERRNRRMAERLARGGERVGEEVASAARGVRASRTIEELATPNVENEPNAPGLVERAAGAVADFFDEEMRGERKRKKGERKLQKRELQADRRAALAAHLRDQAVIDDPNISEERRARQQNFLNMMRANEQAFQEELAKRRAGRRLPGRRENVTIGEEAPKASPPKARKPRAPRNTGQTPAQPQPPAPARRPRNIVNDRMEYLRKRGEELKRLKEEAKKNRPDGVSDKDWKEYKDYVDGVKDVIGYGGADHFVNPESYEKWAARVGKKPPAQAVAKPAEIGDVDNVSGTPVPAGDPLPGESLKDYMDRKYNEHQARIRKIREAGGNAGFLKRDEWDVFHGPVVAEAWKKAQKKNGRGARRVATEDISAEASGRRPRPSDIPDAVQPSRPARPVTPKPQPAKPAAPKRQDPKNMTHKQMMDEHKQLWNDIVDNEINIKNQGETPELRKQKNKLNARRQKLEDAMLKKIPGDERFRDHERLARKARGLTDAVTPQSATPEENLSGTPLLEKLLRPLRGRKQNIGRLVKREGRAGVLPLPHRNTKNMTVEQAIEHIRKGGNLDDVPREHMLEAVSNNLWDPDTKTGRYKAITKNGGRIGDTRIFAEVDKDGKETGEGLVFKVAFQNHGGGPEDQEQNIGEIIGFNFAAAHGFNIDGAVADGKVTNSRGYEGTMMVIPMDINKIPEGMKAVGRSQAGQVVVGAEKHVPNFHVVDMEEQLEDQGAPQRIAHFLHNYLLGAADRHLQNGMARVYTDEEGNKFAHIVPIDHGWVGRAPISDFEQYARDTMYSDQQAGMDPRIFTGIRRHLAGIKDPEEKKRQVDAVIGVVDDMIERSSKLAAMSNDEWVKFVRDFYPGHTDDAHVKRIASIYRRQAQALKTQRSQLLALWGIK